MSQTNNKRIAKNILASLHPDTLWAGDCKINVIKYDSRL